MRIPSLSLPAIPVSAQLHTLRRALLVALLTCGVQASANDIAETDYNAALEQARSAHYDVALPRLEALAAHYPDRRRYFYDYVTVLVWAGRDADALALLPRIQTETAPIYVLESLGTAARNQKNFALATELYNTVLRREPGRPTSVAGLALTQVDAGQPIEALALIEDRRRERPQDPELLDALQVIADNLLSRREPERARDIYREILAQRPDDYNASMGLFYALLDSEDPDGALKVIDRLAAQQPQTTTDPASGQSQTNPYWQRAQLVAAMARAYTNNLSEAQRRLEASSPTAPYDVGTQESLGYVYLWRGWPRLALATFDQVLTRESNARGARIGRVQALQDLRDYPTATVELATLKSEAPGATDLQRAQRNNEIHAMREFRFTAGRGFSDGEELGSRSLDLESYLYSAPFADYWRAYAHAQYSSAHLLEGYELYRRIGAGVEYRTSDLSADAEIDRNTSGSPHAGAQVRVAWTPNDHWLYGLGFDSHSDDVPLRARFYDVRARSVDARIEYRVSEERRFGAGLGVLDFSDDNQRTYASGYVRQRLITKPKYSLDGTLNLYASHNTQENVPYFNPRNDLSLSLSLDNEWLLWRRYDQSFRHRVGGTVGAYSQQEYATAAIWQLRYEQQWNANDRTELRWGVSRSRPTYDGNAEYDTHLYLSLDVRF